MNQAGLIYLLEKKQGHGVVEGSVQDEESFDYYKGKNKGKGSVGLGCVVRSGTTLTLVAWVMLPGGQEEVEKDSAKAAKEEKALASSARAKEKDTVREKDQAMVTGKAMVSEAIGWTMRTTWVLQQRGIARLARASTMVFGVLPRGYLDPEGEIYGDEGQLNPTESTFERSLRLRQIALQASEAAILESRSARANRSRPQRLALEDIKPGTTKVEIFRDDGQGHGWRGPGSTA